MSETHEAIGVVLDTMGDTETNEAMATVHELLMGLSLETLD